MTALLCACSKTPSEPVFHAQGNPEILSEWNILSVDGKDLRLSGRVVPYDLNSALFSDYAHKLRTVWVPDGQMAEYNDTETFAFPVGTIISKTFYYPRDGDTDAVLKTDDNTAQRLNGRFDLSEVRLIETRLLVRREAGWAVFPYVWNAAQTEAKLKRIGDIIPLEISGEDMDTAQFSYIVPNVNQCSGCHATNATTREILPIGPKARHLNKDYDYDSASQNQLSAWQSLGILGPISILGDAPKNADWTDSAQTAAARARAYLDINCAHCHNPVGPADTSGLNLEPDAPHGPALGICKLPIAAGTGTGGRDFDIVPGKPEQSIFTYRMASTNPAEMMPELGRSLRHDEGVDLVTQWIAQMDGRCDRG
ncbi:SO2930 family diheme c-type cytochrome [Robiginitomaculum antarcticum]|uniref:SO2930 family diheme c-type cytochrome n=1 Tax=Robiginitomaculum antarcticum TaxID=437507 RepID=UPI001F25EDCB|nr:SO2930 family diheme c-type cytochrome [Robiginitomaculum antarcticum]